MLLQEISNFYIGSMICIKFYYTNKMLNLLRRIHAIR